MDDVAEVKTTTTDSKKSKWEVGGKAIAKTSAAKKPSKSVNTKAQPVYFYTHENFYVITRYNHSVLYAMAVHDLSVAIAAEKAALDKQ